jgi:hypothetical protein
MGTLELVPLRSKFPYMGHMTVRFEAPLINPDVALDLMDIEDILDSLETTTTPKVAASAKAGETAVRKGVQAR